MTSSKTDAATMTRADLEQEKAKLESAIDEHAKDGFAKLDKATVDRYHEVVETLDAIGRFASKYVERQQPTTPSPTA